MSESTYGIIAGNFENRVFEVIEKIKEALKNFECAHPLISGKKIKSSWGARYDLKDSCRGMTVNFKDGGDERMLWVHFDCHCDKENIYRGEKLILSIGRWGNNEKIIRAMLDQFKGCECYFVPNDCGEDFEKID